VSKRDKITSNWDDGAATEIEDSATFGRKTVDKAAKPFLANGRDPEPIKIGVCNVIITCSDQMSEIRIWCLALVSRRAR